MGREEGAECEMGGRKEGRREMEGEESFRFKSEDLQNDEEESG